MRALGLLGCALIAGCAGESKAQTTKELVFAVNAEHVRALGWVSGEVEEAAIPRAMADLLARRLPFDGNATIAISEGYVRIDFESALPAMEADRITAAVESLGVLEFLLVVPEEASTDEGAVRLERRRRDLQEPPAGARLPTSFSECFGARNLKRTWSTSDAQGFPALSFDFEMGAGRDFHAFTGAHVDEQLAVVIHDVIRSAPTLAEALPGTGMIVGFVDEAEAKALAEEIRSNGGPLRRVR